MTLFRPEDRLALARAEEVRRSAHLFLEQIHDLLPSLLGGAGTRVSRIQEASDRAGLFAFVPGLGNVWIGVPFAGSDCLTLRVEVPADRLAARKATMEGVGLVREGESFVGRVELGDDRDAALARVRTALQRWLAVLLA